MPPVHPHIFKEAMRALAGGITVLASKGEDGTPRGIAATAVCSLSAEPPAVLICVNRSNSLAPLVREGAAVSVNILTAGQDGIARTFGGMTPARGSGRFASGSWVAGRLDVPVLAGCRCALECVALEVLDRFTHRIAICAVHEVHLDGSGASALISDRGRMIALPN